MRYLPFAFIAFFAANTPALADAIDGDWCDPAGAHLKIDGPQIQLGSSAPVTGKYSRHAFSYIAPAGDIEAGKEIFFQLRSEEEMRRLREPNAMPEHSDIWRRCQAVS